MFKLQTYEILLLHTHNEFVVETLCRLPSVAERLHDSGNELLLEYVWQVSA